MTVPSEINRSGPYAGNGVTTVFDYEFRILKDTHIAVVATTGSIDAIVDPAGYSVSGVGDISGGSVTFGVAPASGTSITIIRNVPFTQETDLENQGAYYAETVEAALDLDVMRQQQLQEQVSRALILPVSASVADKDEVIASVIALGDSVDEIVAVAAVADDLGAVAAAIPDIETANANLGFMTAFATLYYGPRSTNPTTRPGGGAPQTGDLYFNTASMEMRVYSASAWVAAATQSLVVSSSSATGDGTTTTFALPGSPVAPANLIAVVGGVVQDVASYSVAGSTVTFVAAPGNGLPIQFRVLGVPSTINVPADGSVSEVKLDAALATKVNSKANATNGTVTTPTLILKQSAAPTPTAEGALEWDTDDDALVVGDGAGQKIIRPNSWERIRFDPVASAVAWTATGLSAFRALRVDACLKPDSANAIIAFQVSTDNGATWVTTGYYYAYGFLGGAAAGSSLVSGQSSIPILGGNQVTPSYPTGFDATLHDFNKSSRLVLNLTTMSYDRNILSFQGGGIDPGSARNALRILAGVNLSGYVSLEGIRG